EYVQICADKPPGMPANYKQAIDPNQSLVGQARANLTPAQKEWLSLWTTKHSYIMANYPEFDYGTANTINTILKFQHFLFFLFIYLMISNLARKGIFSGRQGLFVVSQMLLLLFAGMLLVSRVGETMPFWLSKSLSVIAIGLDFTTQAQVALLALMLAGLAVALYRGAHWSTTIVSLVAMCFLTWNYVTEVNPDLRRKSDEYDTNGAMVTEAAQVGVGDVVTFKAASIGPHSTMVEVKRGDRIFFQMLADTLVYQYHTDRKGRGRWVTPAGETKDGNPVYSSNYPGLDDIAVLYPSIPVGAVAFYIGRGNRGKAVAVFVQGSLREDYRVFCAECNGMIFVDINDLRFVSGRDGSAHHTNNKGTVRFRMWVERKTPPSFIADLMGG
ncbi:hypothetical protein KKG41_00965, partial [Patescibacteria group bacterium]|nr:hypothetical protein [Patescibacteria group bacterium]